MEDDSWYVDLWCHPKMTTVALEIMSKGPTVNDRQELVVRWWDIGRNRHPRDMNIVDVIYPTTEWMNCLEYYVRVSLL